MSKKQLGRTPEKEVKLIRRRKGKGGARFYINNEVLTKALSLAGMDVNCQELYGIASTMKDGKRAKVVLHIYCK